MNWSQDLAYAINAHVSLGLGVDVQEYQGEFDVNILDALSIVNKVTDVGLGWHLGWYMGWHMGWHMGLLYRFTPDTRVGVSYH